MISSCGGGNGKVLISKRDSQIILLTDRVVSLEKQVTELKAGNSLMMKEQV
jgi:hypothetical protein